MGWDERQIVKKALEDARKLLEPDSSLKITAEELIGMDVLEKEEFLKKARIQKNLYLKT